MKTLLVLASFVMMINSSCEQTDVVADSGVDLRDQRIGVYVCEVKLKNYTTQQVSSSYIDTLEISKQELWSYSLRVEKMFKYLHLNRWMLLAVYMRDQVLF